MEGEYDPANPLVDDEEGLRFGHLRNPNRARARLNSYKQSKSMASPASVADRSEDETYDPMNPLTDDEGDERDKFSPTSTGRVYTIQATGGDGDAGTSGCGTSYLNGHRSKIARGSGSPEMAEVVVLSDDDGDDEIQVLSMTEKAGLTWNNKAATGNNHKNNSFSHPNKMAEPHQEGTQTPYTWNPTPTYASSVRMGSPQHDLSPMPTPFSPNESLLERVAEILYSPPAVIAQKHITLDKICRQSLIKLPEPVPIAEAEHIQSQLDDESISSFEPEPGQSMIHIFQSHLPILKPDIPAPPKIRTMAQKQHGYQMSELIDQRHEQKQEWISAGPSDKSDLRTEAQSKHLEKLGILERAVDEVKHALKPHYLQRTINKAGYKEILGRSVRKICNSSSGKIDPARVALLVEAYVKKFEVPNTEMTVDSDGQIA